MQYQYSAVERHLHCQRPFDANGVKLWLSSANSKELAERKYPALGIYLDSIWEPAIKCYGGVELPAAHDYPYVVVKWWDGGVPEWDTIDTLLALVDKYATSGPIEVACIGGHGRTGTFAAMVAVSKGWKAGRAITAVRTKYCANAIESYTQEKAIYVLAGETPPPPPPPVQTWKPATKGGDNDDKEFNKALAEYLNPRLWDEM